MNEKGTPGDITTHIPLTSVDSGTVCRLVGVSMVERRRRKHRGSRGLFASFGRHHAKHEMGKKQIWQNHGRRRIMKRLLDLGLTKGCSFKVIQSRGRGPVLVEVRGTRIALGYGLASQILVEVLGDNR